MFPQIFCNGLNSIFQKIQINTVRTISRHIDKLNVTDCKPPKTGGMKYFCLFNKTLIICFESAEFGGVNYTLQHRGVKIPGARSPGRLNFVGPPCRTCFTPPFWRQIMMGRLLYFSKICEPSAIAFLRYIFA